MNEPVKDGGASTQAPAPALPHDTGKSEVSLSKADTKTTTKSSLPGSITPAKTGEMITRKIIPGKETKTETEREPGYKPSYAGVQPSSLPGSYVDPDIASALLGTPSFRQKAVVETLIPRQEQAAQLQKAIDLQNQMFNVAKPFITLREGLRSQVNFYTDTVLPFKEAGYLRDTTTNNDIRTTSRTPGISTPSAIDKYFIRIFSKKSNLEAIQKVAIVSRDVGLWSKSFGKTIYSDIVYTAKALPKGAYNLLEASRLTFTTPVKELQLPKTREKIQTLVNAPETTTTFLVGGLVALGFIPGGVYASAGISTYLLGKQVKEYAKNPTSPELSARTVLSILVLAPPIVRVGRRGVIAATGKYVKPETVFDPDVLAGLTRFPRTTSALGSLKEFEKVREPQSLVSSYNRYLIKEFKGNAPKGTVIRAAPNSLLVPNLAVVGVPVLSHVRGGKIPTLHVTPASFGKAEVIGRGTSHEAGLFVTPMGRGSPYFTYLPEQVLPKLSLLPEFYNPQAIMIRLRGVERIPKEVIKTEGFEQVNIFLESQAGKGVGYITKRSEAAFDKSLSKGFRPTHELEAVIPVGTKIKSGVKGNVLQNLLGFKEYTIYKGEFIPIKTYDVALGKVPKIQFASQVENIKASSSSLRDIGRARLSPRLDVTTKKEIPILEYRPSIRPPVRPVIRTTLRPTIRPSVRPAVRPSIRPTIRAATRPTIRPTTRPSTRPSVRPTLRPTIRPSVRPTIRPGTRPTLRPITRPTIRPTTKPGITPKITFLLPRSKDYIPKLKRQETKTISKGLYAPSLAGIFGLIPQLEKVPKPTKSQIGLFSGITLRPGVIAKPKTRSSATFRFNKIGIKPTVRRAFKKEKITKRGLPKWIIA